MNAPKTYLLAACLSLLLFTACSSHPRKVDCEGHLTPINDPATAPKQDDNR